MSDRGNRDRRPATIREIQALLRPEAEGLARIWRQINPGQSKPAERFSKDVGRLIDHGGRVWLVVEDMVIAGYGFVAPTSGLPGLYEVDGFIAPARRRQGLATILLAAMIKELAGSTARQLYHPVMDMTSAAAQFLLANHFYLEHEELFLVLNDLDTLPSGVFASGLAIRSFGRAEAIPLFRDLYGASFGSLPWFQPYESDREVAADLPDEGDLLFLTERDRPVGFLWLRWPELRTAEIEPVGLLPAYQGRGLGRQLILAGVRQAKQQGATRVTVAAWRENQKALTLYERLGFKETHSKYYLAHDLKEG